jgi:hypothetical protein
VFELGGRCRAEATCDIGNWVQLTLEADGSEGGHAVGAAVDPELR